MQKGFRRTAREISESVYIRDIKGIGKMEIVGIRIKLSRIKVK